MLWSKERLCLACASDEDIPMELQVVWAVPLTNTLVLAFIFL